jgi:hypothetical protein
MDELNSPNTPNTSKISNNSDTSNTNDSSDENTSEEVEQAMKKLLAIDPWEEVGFHRPLASFWYGLAIGVFSSIISLFFISIIYEYLYPYPEMQGYNQVAGLFFAIVYQFFDMGTAFGIERFIGEYRVKNPKKMLEYVSFFIWYQMFTGIIQVMVISIWIFQYIVVSPDLSYLAFLFLIICQKQWPGMLGTFGSVLKGLQKFNKSQILSFVGGQVFQNITNIVFILAGRWWGQQNPVYGDLMGGAIGYALGLYIDDFFTMILGGYFLNKELAILGFSLREAITPTVSKDVMKQCFSFGFQASLVPLLNIASETIILLMFLDHLPQYTTWVVLKSFASGLAGIVNVGNFEMTSSIAESYSNKKKALSQFYVSYSLKWNTYLKIFLLMTMIGIYPVIIRVISELDGLENYQAAVIFIPFLLVEQIFFAFIQISDPILMGTLHIKFYTFVRLLEEIIRVFILYLLLVVWGLGKMGPIGIALTLGWDRFYARFIKMIIALIYIDRKIFKVKIYWMSTAILPILAALPVLGISLYISATLFSPLEAAIGLIPAAAVFILVFILILPTCVFLPLSGFLGSFDDFQLKTFAKAVQLSGPAKPIVKIFYRAVYWGHQHCPWKNKFKIPWEIPTQEMNELLILKASHKLQSVKKN